MQISTNELRKACELLLTHLEESGHSAIEITRDYYWNVPQEQRYDPYQEPAQFDMGQLSDDWSELQGILEGRKVTVSYALVWLSSILRSVGETVVE
jgi:hypothetical protein